MEEFGFSFIRRLKNEVLEKPFVDLDDFKSSSPGAAGVYGTLFSSLCTKLLVELIFPDISKIPNTTRLLSLRKEAASATDGRAQEVKVVQRSNRICACEQCC